jgi:hypothetical protein
MSGKLLKLAFGSLLLTGTILGLSPKLADAQTRLVCSPICCDPSCSCIRQCTGTIKCTCSSVCVCS